MSGLFDGHTAGIYVLAFSLDGERITSGSGITQSESGMHMRTILFQGHLKIKIYLDPWHSRLTASASSPPMVGFWMQKRAILCQNVGHFPCAVSPDGRHIVYVDANNSIPVKDA
jgi:WD40 repeat protein